MKLGARLQTIYDMVKEPCVLADIGCDHARLPIALLQSHKCSYAYACDIHEGPLLRAKTAIQQAGLQEQIQVILCDGLDGLGDDVTTIVIAGMGYDTITGILLANMDKLSHYKQMIIQCNTHVCALRRWLSNHDLCIDDEQLVQQHHYYQMLSIHVQKQVLSEEQCMFGVYLEQHPLFVSYWSFILSKQKQILHHLKEQQPAYQKTKHTIQQIEQKLKKRSTA